MLYYILILIFNILFRTDRGSDIPNGIIYNDINFELCCVMFNIGASHVAIAANETRSDSDVFYLFLFLTNFSQKLRME